MTKQILNPLGMVGSVETRPAAYFPTMTDEELITYAESFAGTRLETELTKRLVLALDSAEGGREEAYDRGKVDGYEEAEELLTNPDVCENCGSPVHGERMNMKPEYVAQSGDTRAIPGTPTPDEWGEIYDAGIDLVNKLGELQWKDRDIAFKEYSRFIDALNARGEKKFIPL